MRNPSSLYLTLSGLPIRIDLEWPFHASQSGADWFSLHGRVWLADGMALGGAAAVDSGLHADVAVNLTQTMKEALPSLTPEHAESVVVNAVRKALDVQQLELLKSGKRQPVSISTRHYDFKRRQMLFVRADDEQLRDFVLRSTWWTAARAGAAPGHWLTDDFDLAYLNTTAEQMMVAAQRLAAEGLIAIDGDRARATDALLARAEDVVDAMRVTLHKLEAKHAFERG
jgi:hypothetical protein